MPLYLNTVSLAHRGLRTHYLSPDFWPKSLITLINNSEIRMLFGIETQNDNMSVSQ